MVARRYGAELAMAEVVLDEHVLLHGTHRTRIFKIGEDDHPLGGQLMGSRPEQFGEAAHQMVEAGYDLIDINFGCPVRKVLGRCRGGYLLSEPDMALAIIKSVIRGVAGRRPVTVKMRRGFDETADSERNFFEILDGAFGLGVAAVTVHGRTVKQRYVGPSNWGFLARVKRHAGRNTILGSGDLFSAGAVHKMMEETGVDGASVARGAIGNPFIFRECGTRLLDGRVLPPPSVAEQRQAIELHLTEIAKSTDAAGVGPVFRKFGISYADLHPMGREVRQAFIDAKTTPAVGDVLATWYDEGREWPLVKPRKTLGHMIAAGAEA